MGEPTQPSDHERIARRELARQIVDSVASDEAPPRPIDRLLTLGTWGYEVFLVVFTLAQELVMRDAEACQLEHDLIHAGQDARP